MKASTISTLRKELISLPPGDVIAVCMRLAKFKKENKELLSYLLFDSNNEAEYIVSIKQEIDLQFAEINKDHLYFAKKSIRKIVKNTNKYIKYSNVKQTEVELIIYFCLKLKKSGIHYKSSTSLNTLYANQVRKAKLAIATLHEDLQFDYLEELNTLV